MLTQAQLKAILHYSPDTGIFTRVDDGERRDKICKDGYRRMSVSGRRCLAHRCAWIYMHGDITNQTIDHINGVRDDNRIDNLRMATFQQNQFNRKTASHNKTGFKGVSRVAHTKKYRVRATLNKKDIHIGYFASIDDANNAYIRFVKTNHGEFIYNGGNPPDNGYTNGNR